MMIKIELWSDFGCPFCYIGKTRFENALNRFPHKDQVEVEYKAYLLNPNALKVMEASPAETFAKGHHMTVEQAQQRFQMFTDNAKTVGLEYRYDIIQMTNTFDAHRVAKLANTKGLEARITARFMKAYFTEGLNIADHDTLIKLSVESGLVEEEVKEVLSSNQFEDLVRQQISESRQVGVQGVPFFVLDRKYGVSGAQQEDYFYQVLEYLWNEHQELETIDGGDSGHVCNDETCEI